MEACERDDSLNAKITTQSMVRNACKLLQATRIKATSHLDFTVKTTSKMSKKVKALAPVVQRPDNFICWIRHYPESKIYFMLNVVQGFRTLLN